MDYAYGHQGPQEPKERVEWLETRFQLIYQEWQQERRNAMSAQEHADLWEERFVARERDRAVREALGKLIDRLKVADNDDGDVCLDGWLTKSDLEDLV